MGLKIRLRQQGRTNRLTYRLVVADSRSPRDGKYVENLGHYDPHLEEGKDAVVKEERIQHWVDNGAEISEKAHALIARKAPALLSLSTPLILSFSLEISFIQALHVEKSL